MKILLISFHAIVKIKIGHVLFDKLNDEICCLAIVDFGHFGCAITGRFKLLRIEVCLHFTGM